MIYVGEKLCQARNCSHVAEISLQTVPVNGGYPGTVHLCLEHAPEGHRPSDRSVMITIGRVRFGLPRRPFTPANDSTYDDDGPEAA